MKQRKGKFAGWEQTLFNVAPDNAGAFDDWNEAEERRAFEEWTAAVQRLQESDRAEKRANKYTPTDTANGLTRAIIRYIELSGGQAERINVFGRPITAKQGGREYIVRWAASQMTTGTADISATIQGRSVKIEVKVGKDYQSEAQKRYQKQVEAAGGIYYIAHTFDDFKTWYDATFTQGGGALWNMQ